MVNKTSNKFSNVKTWKIVLTIVFLLMIFVIPILSFVGIILMWIWMKWPKWVKALITAPITLFFFLIFFTQAAALSYLFIMRPNKIAGQSMSPKYNNGAFWVGKVIKSKDEIKRGDVIVFISPDYPDKEAIKRVIGLSGESISIKNGQVYIGGKILDESSYLASDIKTGAGTFIKEGQTIKIPFDNYFVLGDNRNLSRDSRQWGFIPQQDVKTKLSFCYWHCK